MTAGKTIDLTRWAFVGKVMSLLYNELSRFFIDFLPRSKRLLFHGCNHHLQWFWSPQKESFSLFQLFPHLRTMKWWDWMPWSSVQFHCSVMSNSLQPHDCSTPGFLVHHQLSELTQIHVHWVSDAIQQSHPLSSLSPLAFNLFIRVFSDKSVLCIRWPKYWSFSFSISLSNEYSGLTGSRDSQESSRAPQFKSINFSVLGFLYGPTLTSIHDYWKNHSFD